MASSLPPFPLPFPRAAERAGVRARAGYKVTSTRVLGKCKWGEREGREARQRDRAKLAVAVPVVVPVVAVVVPWKCLASGCWMALPSFFPRSCRLKCREPEERAERGKRKEGGSKLAEFVIAEALTRGWWPMAAGTGVMARARRMSLGKDCERQRGVGRKKRVREMGDEGENGERGAGCIVGWVIYRWL